MFIHLCVCVCFCVTRGLLWQWSKRLWGCIAWITQQFLIHPNSSLDILWLTSVTTQSDYQVFNPPLRLTGWVWGPRMIFHTRNNPAPSIFRVRGRGTCCCSSYCHYCCVYMAPCSRGLVLCCAGWHVNGQLSARCVKPKRCTGLYLSTLGLSLIGRQLMPYHCFMVLFVAVGFSDITGVDISSPANNTSVYLCLWDTGWTLPDGSMPPPMRYQSK